jgi:hypothetical protein
MKLSRAMLRKRFAEIKEQTADLSKVVGGVVRHCRSGRAAPESARRALLRLHCETNGRTTDYVESVVRRLRPARPISPVRGMLHDSLTREKRQEIAGTIKRDGFYVFPQRIPADICKQIEEFAEATTATVEGAGREPEHRKLFNSSCPISKTYRFVEEDSINTPCIQQVMADPTFLAVAESYLRTLPILSNVSVWWSATYGDTPGDNAAQEFHFDFDPPPKWLNFFIYLNDVGPANGPHVYVRGSHVAGHSAAADLLKRGYARIQDKDIAQAFGAENIVELTGLRGTVIAADTRGFHKGKMPTAGCRLMMQFTFSSPLFSGANDMNIKFGGTFHPQLAEAIKATPTVFSRYLSA